MALAASKVLRLDLEVALRMVAHGTHFRRLLADDDMSAVAALPDDITLAREHHSILDVLQQLAIAFLVMFLDGAYEFKLRIKEPSRDSHAENMKVEAWWQIVAEWQQNEKKGGKQRFFPNFLPKVPILDIVVEADSLDAAVLGDDV